MKNEGSFLGVWKERGLLILVAAALVVYSLRLVASASTTGEKSRTDPLRETDQRYVRSSKTLALPEDSRAVFAETEPEAYFDEALRRVWVEPKIDVGTTLRLDPPPPTIPAPPMLLPVPGPVLQFTSGLRRWPRTPPPAPEEEEAEGEKAEGEK